jgi:uncharacterized protein YndB with AHSA1/START domain
VTSGSEASFATTRIFDAPRRRVFDAWTRAEHLEQWFGPRGFAVTDCAADPRPGGVFRLCMRAPSGAAYWVRGEFREVVVPERLVISCTLDDEQGVPRLAELINVDFEDRGSRTRLRLTSSARGSGAEAATMLAGMHKGWTQTVDRLGVLLGPKPDKEM